MGLRARALQEHLLNTALHSIKTGRDAVDATCRGHQWGVVFTSTVSFNTVYYQSSHNWWPNEAESTVIVKSGCPASLESIAMSNDTNWWCPASLPIARVDFCSSLQSNEIICTIKMPGVWTCLLECPETLNHRHPWNDTSSRIHWDHSTLESLERDRWPNPLKSFERLLGILAWLGISGKPNIAGISRRCRAAGRPSPWRLRSCSPWWARWTGDPPCSSWVSDLSTPVASRRRWTLNMQTGIKHTDVETLPIQQFNPVVIFEKRQNSENSQSKPSKTR